MRRRHATMAAALLILVSACGNDSTSSPSSATATTNTATHRSSPRYRCRHRSAAGRGHRPGDDRCLDPRRNHRHMGSGGTIRPSGGSRRQGQRRAHEDRRLQPNRSMTKTFTVTAILQLAEQGKIGLDDPIGKYIDGVPNGDKIALRELARMRSGLENYANVTEFQQALVADPYRNSPHRNSWATRSQNHRYSLPAKGFSTRTPTPSCWGSWWKRSAGRNCPTTSAFIFWCHWGWTTRVFPPRTPFRSRTRRATPPRPHPERRPRPPTGTRPGHGRRAR